jgi:hypothetical protein
MRTLAVVTLISAFFLHCNVSAQVTVITNWSTGTSQTNQFNTNNGYIAAGSSLDGQATNAPAAQQWQTTDPYDSVTDRGSSSSLQFLSGWTAGVSPGGNNSVRFGGFGVDFGAYLPGITNPILYREFDSVLVSPADAVTFSIDFSIIGPSPDLNAFYTNRDYFSLSFMSSSGASNLATIVFNPFTSTLPGGTGFRADWIQNGTNVVTNGSTFSGISFNNNSLWRLNATLAGSAIDLTLSGLIPQSGAGVGITNYLVTNTRTVISGGALSAGLTAADFERLDIGWELTSGSVATPGANYMIINAMSVVSELQVIPEPSTWVAAGILVALAGGIAARKRRKS